MKRPHLKFAIALLPIMQVLQRRFGRSKIACLWHDLKFAIASLTAHKWLRFVSKFAVAAIPFFFGGDSPVWWFSIVRAHFILVSHQQRAFSSFVFCCGAAAAEEGQLRT